MARPVVLVTATTSCHHERSEGSASTEKQIPHCARDDSAQSRLQLEEAYTGALLAAGVLPLVLPPIAGEIAVQALDHVAGLVLTGGEDIDPSWFGASPHPAAGPSHMLRDEYELALTRAAHARKLPTLALCRGQQIMNLALGGTLIQDIPTEWPGGKDHPRSRHGTDRVHPVNIVSESRLARVLGTTRPIVNSFHHQAIGQLSKDLKVVGSSPDGIIEAIEPNHPGWWMIGVQWHPEHLTNTIEDWDRRLFKAFADALV